jgi:hypothetical protein
MIQGVIFPPQLSPQKGMLCHQFQVTILRKYSKISGQRFAENNFTLKLIK